MNVVLALIVVTLQEIFLAQNFCQFFVCAGLVLSVRIMQFTSFSGYRLISLPPDCHICLSVHHFFLTIDVIY